MRGSADLTTDHARPDAAAGLRQRLEKEIDMKKGKGGKGKGGGSKRPCVQD